MPATVKNFGEYLDFADPYYKAAHNGQSMPSAARAHLTSILAATDNILDDPSGMNAPSSNIPREAYLNLASATYASLISPDICIEGPEGRMSGWVTYMDFSDPQHTKQETIPMLASMYHVATLPSNGQDWLDFIADREAFANDKLAAQMVQGLQSYIDGEVIKNALNAVDIDPDLLWSKTDIPIGVAKIDHYESFAEMLEIGRSRIYKKNLRVLPNYVIIPPTLEEVVSTLRDFTPAVNHLDSDIYFFGNCAGFRVYTDHTITDGSFLMGVNNPGYVTSALAFAPYLPISLTSVLGIPGSPGVFGPPGHRTRLSLSTAFSYCVLNSSLLIKGQVPDATCSDPSNRLIDLTTKVAGWKKEHPRSSRVFTVG